MIPHLAWTVISLYEKPGIDHENQQISVQNRLRKRNGNELTRLSQRKRCGNTKQCLHFHLTRFPSYPSCGNVTEFWTIRFPQHFRIAETPYFTLWYFDCVNEMDTRWRASNKFQGFLIVPDLRSCTMLSTLPLFYIAQSVNSDDRRARFQGLRVIMGSCHVL